jgi:hypothetical protein
LTWNAKRCAANEAAATPDVTACSQNSKGSFRSKAFDQVTSTWARIALAPCRRQLRANSLKVSTGDSGIGRR